jgi:anaphase-promoting complex subunit 6
LVDADVRTHLPLLFLGMQHLQLNNLQLAEEYLLQAQTITPNDPLLQNELGVAAFEKARYVEATHYFHEAIRVAEDGEWDQAAWTCAWTNLGHAYRKMGYTRGDVSFGLMGV